MKHHLRFMTLKRVSLALFGMCVVFFAVSNPRSSTAASLPKTVSSTQSPQTDLAAHQYKLFLPFIQTTFLTPAKKGVPMTYSDCTDLTKIGAIWQYNWSPQPLNCPAVENVPMIWGTASVNSKIGGNSQWVMGFNEPDLTSQSNISPASAAVLWRQIEQQYPTRKLVAPVPSHLHPTWLVDFRNAYIAKYGTAPRLNALAIHCYSETASFCIQLGQTFEQWAQQWNVSEIWVTEFAILSCSGTYTITQILQEAQTFTTWMENQSIISRMAWYATRLQGTMTSPCYSSLIDWNTHNLTLYGNLYSQYK